jgi:hypothetical protein
MQQIHASAAAHPRPPSAFSLTSLASLSGVEPKSVTRRVGTLNLLLRLTRAGGWPVLLYRLSQSFQRFGLFLLCLSLVSRGTSRISVQEAGHGIRLREMRADLERPGYKIETAVISLVTPAASFEALITRLPWAS